VIDFQQMDLIRFSKFLTTVDDNGGDPTLYFDLGRMIEIALAEYSNGLLKRIVGAHGKDLVDAEGISYESKKVTFANKLRMDVRNAVVLNYRGNADISKFKPADYYIFTDPSIIRACCVPGHMLYNIRTTDSGVTASADPTQDHFFLDGILPEYRLSRQYFTEKNDFVMNFIESIK